MFVVDGDGESFFVVVSCSGGGGLKGSLLYALFKPKTLCFL